MELWRRGIILAGLAGPLLLAGPAWADQQDDLTLAAAEGHVALVGSLLRQNVDINGPDRAGQTPLMRAVRSGQLEMVQLLLNHGAAVTVRDWQGRTAMQYAKDQGRTGVVEVLKHQQAFASAYLPLMGRPGKHTLWGGTLHVVFGETGTTRLTYTRAGLTLPQATMVARTLGGAGLDYGSPVLDEGWVTFPAEGKAAPRVSARIRSFGYTAQQVEVTLR